MHAFEIARNKVLFYQLMYQIYFFIHGKNVMNCFEIVDREFRRIMCVKKVRNMVLFNFGIKRFMQVEMNNIQYKNFIEVF